MIVYQTTYCPGCNGLDLSVVTDGLTVTVEAGTFCIARVDYTIPANIVFVAAAGTHLDGCLVVDRATREVSLRVNQALNEETHELLVNFLWADIPSGAASLDDVDIRVARCVPSPEEETP